MGRTNVVVDDELIGKVMRLYGLRTKREAIDFALRRAAGDAEESRELAPEVGEADWWARHFEAVRGHPIGE